MTPPINEDLVEKHRDINVDDGSWSEALVGRWSDELTERGWHNVDIRWSGFWSQGDGASFTGTMDLAGLGELLTAYGLTDAYPASCLWLRHGALYDVRLYLEGGRHQYSHSGTVWARLEYEASTEGVKDDALAAILNANEPRLRLELAALEDIMEAVAKGLMAEIYADLEAEYEYLTSDEQVWETIVANDLHLDVENPLDDAA